MKIDVRVTEEDIYKYKIKSIFKAFSSMARFIAYMVYFCGIALGIKFVITSHGNLRNILGTLFFILIPFLIYYVLGLFLKRNAKRHLKNASELVSYEINTDGLIIQNKEGQHLVNWNQFYGFDETEDNYLFYLSEYHVLFIPRRFIDTNKENSNYLIKCVQNVPPRKKEKLEKNQKNSQQNLRNFIYSYLFMHEYLLYIFCGYLEPTSLPYIQTHLIMFTVIKYC